MRTPAQRGRYGRWLVGAREDRGFDTADKALRALEAAGIRIGRSAYAEYESGTKVPSRNHLPLLEGFWGPVPEEDVPAPDLAAAIAALTVELRASRLEREATEARLRAVEAELQSLRETRAGAGSPGQPAPMA